MNWIFKRHCKSLFTVQFYPINKCGKNLKKERRPQEPILSPRFTSPRFPCPSFTCLRLTSPVQSSPRNTVCPSFWQIRTSNYFWDQTPCDPSEQHVHSVIVSDYDVIEKPAARARWFMVGFTSVLSEPSS